MVNVTKLLLVGLLSVWVVGCGSDEGETLYVMHQSYEHDAEYDVGPATGCTLAVYENGGGGQPPGDPSGLEGDFLVFQSTEGAGLHVSVRSFEQVLATRDYDVNFVRSGEVDSFSVTTQAGRVFDLAFWGGPTCDTSPHEIAVPDAGDDSTAAD